MCIKQMKAEVLLSSQTTVLHILTLLNEAISFLSKEYIKVCMIFFYREIYLAYMILNFFV